MKKFQFPLQKVLEIRQKKENAQKIKLSKVSGEYQLEIQKKESFLNQIQEERTRIKDRLVNQSDQINLKDLQYYDYEINQSRLVSHYLDGEIAKKKVLVEKELKVFLDLQKDKRAVELLKEKAVEEYKEQYQKEQENFVTEIAQRVYLKNKEK